MAKSSLVMVLMTPYQVVLRLSWSKVVPAKASFTLLKRKKLAGAKSGE
jgi:hypothetical protein